MSESAKFCVIKEPDNPLWNERFECKDCGENFITRCDGFRLKAQIDARDAVVVSQRGLIEHLAAALRGAERKMSAYVGVCKGDKELTDTILPMSRRALHLVDEHEAALVIPQLAGVSDET